MLHWPQILALMAKRCFLSQNLFLRICRLKFG
jgi:hypothetical protein